MNISIINDAHYRQALISVLHEQHESIINNVCSQLQKLYSSHYEVIDFEKHQEREEALFKALVQSLESDTFAPLVTFIQDIAEIRSDEGYRLQEVQQAVQVFSEEVWSQLLASQKANRRLVAFLCIIHAAFDTVKEHLARTYLDKATTSHKELDSLKEKFYFYKHTQKDTPDEETY